MALACQVSHESWVTVCVELEGVGEFEPPVCSVRVVREHIIEHKLGNGIACGTPREEAGLAREQPGHPCLHKSFLE